ncbi:hypothetical protein [Saccharopolyspora oryzae]|uniref:Uncharacterized protein n=1 Tax=Saccharopolyspora oryzae TaxID=2997343 RepID=A0ABT4V5F9_9PSEU|nr:hypothetical protein [Saccharopolyspora oryzae]MDA3629194.1 hypothetical protein [Saccharopolyspora oryzae]
MDIDEYDGDRQDVFWIVGMGLAQRHATIMRPGAVYAGQAVPALCATELKIPQPTPIGRDPRSAKITDKCPTCAERVAEADFAETTWDF